MNVLDIAGTDETPRILFDGEKGELEVSGRSLPEDATSFYGVAFDWISQYMKSPLPQTSANFKLEYFNTASAKQLFRLLSLISQLAKNHKVVINWYYHSEDKDMLSSGERFSKLLNLPISMYEY